MNKLAVKNAKGEIILSDEVIKMISEIPKCITSSNYIIKEKEVTIVELTKNINTAFSKIDTQCVNPTQLKSLKSYRLFGTPKELLLDAYNNKQKYYSNLKKNIRSKMKELDKLKKSLVIYLARFIYDEDYRLNVFPVLVLHIEQQFHNKLKALKCYSKMYDYEISQIVQKIEKVKNN